jgi:hypothetical protein
VVAQDDCRVALYRRDADGAWPTTPSVHTRDDALALPGLTTGIAVDELYDGILDETGLSHLR